MFGGPLLIAIFLCTFIYFFAPRLLRRRNRSNTAYFGKVVVITGASSGIGEALALFYASLGASLVLAARRSDKLKSVADKCSKLGSPVLCVQADVSKEEDCKNLIEKTIDETGRIDILILNAGITMLKRLDELKNLDGVKKLMDVNFWGTVYCTFHALKYLKESRGTICVVSSLLGKGWAPTRTAYAASKHALDGFFHSLRLEVRGQVQITLVYPGFVKTEIHDRALGAEGNVHRETDKFMSAEECAKIIVEAIEDRKTEEIFTLSGKLMNYLNPFVPSLVDRAILRKINQVRLK